MFLFRLFSQIYLIYLLFSIFNADYNTFQTKFIVGSFGQIKYLLS